MLFKILSLCTQVSNIFSRFAESPSSVLKGWESDEVSEGKNKSSLVEIVPNNSSDSELSVKREENGNLSAVAYEKGQIQIAHVTSGFNFPQFVIWYMIL